MGYSHESACALRRRWNDNACVALTLRDLRAMIGDDDDAFLGGLVADYAADASALVAEIVVPRRCLVVEPLVFMHVLDPSCGNASRNGPPVGSNRGGARAQSQASEGRDRTAV